MPCGCSGLFTSSIGGGVINTGTLGGRPVSMAWGGTFVSGNIAGDLPYIGSIPAGLCGVDLGGIAGNIHDDSTITAMDAGI